MGMRHIVNRRLPGSKIFFSRYHINGRIFEKKEKNTEQRICVLIFSTTSV
jgi:hypothetical protein